MKIIRSKYYRLGVKYLTVFNRIFCGDKARITVKDINHESIHWEQQKELLIIGFYILYLMEFLYKLIKLRNAHEAYRNISFEKEAYDNDDNLDYLKYREHFAMWKTKTKYYDKLFRN